MEKWSRRKGALSLTILTVTPLLLLVVAFTWESTGVNPLNLLIPHQQSGGGQNLSNSASGNVNSYDPDVATGGGEEVYVVWKENMGTAAEIYFKASTDGTNWPSGTGTSLTNGDANAERLYSAIAVENGAADTLHVVWEDHGGSDKDILYRKSANGGNTWSPDLSVAATEVTNDTTYDDRAPDIAVNGTVPYVVWYRNDTIFYSKDDGGGWTVPYTVSVSTKPNRYPAIASSGGRLHVTWDVYTGTSEYHLVHYRRSSDGGTNWTNLEDISGVAPTGVYFTFPDVAASGNDVYVVWNSYVDKWANQIYTFTVRCRRSSNGGESWLPATTVATPTTTFLSPYPAPRVTIDISGTVHVVWHGVGSESEIWHSSSENGGVTWSTPTNLTNDPDRGAWLASVAVDDSNRVHVVWQQDYQEEAPVYEDVYWTRTDLAGGGGGGVYLPIILKNSS